MVEVTRVAHASPDTVWQVLGNGWLYPVWVVGASRMRDVEDRWPAVGSRLHHSFGVWPAVIDDTTSVLESEPGHRIKLQARGWPVGEATVELVLEPVPDAGAETGVGTRMVLREDATKGPGRYIPAPLRAAALLPRNHETLRRLALIAEGHAHPTRTTEPAPGADERTTK